MWEWLLSPIDTGRPHDVGLGVAWHARLMVLGWGILAPSVVIIARFFKVVPGQDWPRELDNLFWWRSHWIGQSVVLLLSFIGLALVMPPNFSDLTLHQWLGYSVFAGLIVQVLLGIFRGSKGGPTAPAADGSLHGHHYDMTQWRRMFETLHKTIGYGVIICAAVTILLGLWDANGPKWMWIIMLSWWAALVCMFCLLQSRGMAVDTYQAIWGDDPSHPGNQLAHPKWGVRRSGRGAVGGGKKKEDSNVRHDRRDRVRGQ